MNLLRVLPPMFKRLLFIVLLLIAIPAQACLSPIKTDEENLLKFGIWNAVCHIDINFLII